MDKTPGRPSDGNIFYTEHTLVGARTTCRSAANDPEHSGGCAAGRFSSCDVGHSAQPAAVVASCSLQCTRAAEPVVQLLFRFLDFFGCDVDALDILD